MMLRWIGEQRGRRSWSPSSVASDRAAAKLSCFNGSNSSTEMEETARVDHQPRRKEEKKVKRRGSDAGEAEEEVGQRW